jgi:hypothetical protein
MPHRLMSESTKTSPPEARPVKLYEVLPRELHPVAPLSVLLGLRHEDSFWEYPFAFLVALELPGEAAAAYAELSRGRCSS